MNDYFSCAYSVLEEVYRQHAFSQLKLNEILKEGDRNDAALITKIVYGVLENDLYLEYVIRCAVPKRPKPAVFIVLKIGTFLLKFLNSVPDYAIVNNAVNLTKKLGKGALSGFVNASLKRIASSEVRLPDAREEYLSVKYSYPQWFVRCCVAQYGEELAEKILAYRASGDTAIRINANFTDEGAFEKLLQGKNIAYRKCTVKNMYYVSHNTMTNSRIPDYLYTNQGISSVMVCRAMQVKPASRILDVCAAPGGKSVLLAEMNAGGIVTAWDLYPHRVALIKKYAARMRVKNVRAEVHDASDLREEFCNRFDYVLCDVPCSGFGVAAEKPDIKLNRTESDVAELAKTQAQILRTCSRYVKPGGTLLYSTCTILRQENQDIVDSFLMDNREFSAQEIQLEVQPSCRVGKYVQLLPHADGMQGFFMARLERKKHV